MTDLTLFHLLISGCFGLVVSCLLGPCLREKAAIILPEMRTYVILSYSTSAGKECKEYNNTWILCINYISTLTKLELITYPNHFSGLKSCCSVFWKQKYYVDYSQRSVKTLQELKFYPLFSQSKNNIWKPSPNGNEGILLSALMGTWFPQSVLFIINNVHNELLNAETIMRESFFSP